MKIAMKVAAALFLALSALPMPVNAQDYFNEIGIPEYTTAQPVEGGFLNLPNGNLHLELPISNVGVRGGRKIINKLVYDSLQWREVTGSVLNGGSAPIWYSDAIDGPFSFNATSGWRMVYEAGAFVPYN